MTRPSTPHHKARRTWMPGTSSAKTRFALLPGHDDLLGAFRASYAARTPARNVPTSPESCSACLERFDAAASTMPAALPVSFAAVLTPPILVVTSLVASAVCETLRAI